MRVLLDTHTLLWFLEDNPKLSATARRVIEYDATDAYISIASIWEIAIKHSLGKLRLGRPIDDLFPTQLTQNNLVMLNISIHHALQIATLPLHHRDPFDRMLVAQALADDLTLISVDASFDPYGAPRIW